MFVLDGGMDIPVVVLVVEGGDDCIKSVRASVREGIPVVVCEGSGRASDIVAFAYKNVTRRCPELPLLTLICSLAGSILGNIFIVQNWFSSF